MDVKIVGNFGYTVCGFNVPMGAVLCKYGEAPRTVYAWVENLELAKRNNHFTLFMATRNARRPKKIYVDGQDGIARVLQEYIRNLPEIPQVRKTISSRSISSIAPKDRKVGTYLMRGRPGYDTAPNITTENTVTNGCRIGKNFYTDEGYWAYIDKKFR